VSEEANGFKSTPGIYTEEQVEGWKKVTEAVHNKESLIICQLWHLGRAAHSSFLEGKQIVSASDVPIPGQTHAVDGSKVDFETPRPLSIEEIEATIESYGKAAANAKKAGFDGVEIHSANGYLIDQFLQTCSNKRTDKYGGDMEARFTFLQQVVERVLQEFPASRVGVRLSPNGAFNGMGAEDNNELFKFVATKLDSYNLAFLHVMDGLGFGYHEKSPVVELSDIRPLFKGSIIGNCGYTAETAVERIEAGHADAIAFGRPYLANPDLAERFANGWPLAEMAPMDTWYSGQNDDNPGEGYSDWPNYS